MATRPPHYRRVADDIEQKIRSGEFPSGHQLPSVSELGVIYNIARSTAYRAVKELHARNLVYGQQGQGVYVNDNPPRNGGGDVR